MSALLGIFGGTFDPIHNGHLLVAEHLLTSFNFLEIKFLPCKLPVHKDPTHATAEQRVEMLRLALAGQEKLSIDTRELERESPSYMLETLQSFRKELPTAKLALIIGTDSFIHLDQWRAWTELTNYANIIVVKRPRVNLVWSEVLRSQFDSKVISSIDEFCTHRFGRLYFFETETLDVSSGKLRQDFREKTENIDLLPRQVQKYITSNKIYS